LNLNIIAQTVDIVYLSVIGCLGKVRKMEYDDEEYKKAAYEMVERNRTVEVYKPKKIRKLRVVKKSWYEERRRIGMEKAAAKLMSYANAFSRDNIIKKLERIEGNDIADIIEARVLGGKIKEVHVTGRIAKKLWASDRVDDSLGGRRSDGMIATMYSIPVIYNLDSFPDRDNLSKWNPTGREEWLKEIKFIEE
jgi:hypothetical protein